MNIKFLTLFRKKYISSPIAKPNSKSYNDQQLQNRNRYYNKRAFFFYNSLNNKILLYIVDKFHNFYINVYGISNIF